MGQARSALRRFVRLAVMAGVFVAFAPTAVVLIYAMANPPVTPLMVIRWLDGDGAERAWRNYDAISPHLARAAIAAEDNWFCRHRGFDLEAMKAQFSAWQAGQRPRGASTITMQTAKNIVLWPERGLVRKAIEVWMTPQLELFWSKRRILEVYLNVAETGRGLFGAEAAARHYFGKSALGLTPREAALIAVALPNPRVRSPARPTPALVRSARIIERRMQDLGPLLDCAG